MFIPDIEELKKKHGSKLQYHLKKPEFFLTKIIGLKLTWYHKEWLKLAEKNQRLSIMCARGHGKSEVLLISYFIFKAFTKKGWQGLLVSASLANCVELLKRIKTHIMDNPILNTSVPKDKNISWNQTQIELSNGSRIFCKSYNENIRGYHVDLVGIDECGEFRDHSIFWNTLSPVVNNKDGNIIAIGTPTALTDLLHKLEENEEYKSMRYPAIMKKKPIWPDRFNLAKLGRIRKEIGTLSFSREYMLKPLSSDDQIFPYNLIENALCYDMSFSLMGDKRKNFFIGVDFAMSGASGADYTVITVIDRNKDNDLIIDFIERKKGMSYHDQKLRILQLNEIYRPQKILIDEGNVGQTFLQDLRNYNIPIRGYKFTKEKREELIKVLRNTFENQKLKIPYSKDIQTKRLINELLNELSHFGVKVKNGKVKFEGIGAHDDMVMSLALVCMAARKNQNTGLNYYVGRSSNQLRRQQSNIIFSS